MDRQVECNKLYIVGIGPGNKDYTHPAALGLIDAADVLIGGRRQLDAFKALGKEEVVIGHSLEAIVQYIAGYAGEKQMTVLASGDPGIFSIAGFLRKRLSELKIPLVPDINPGISSLQYLCAKVGKSWDTYKITSLHGKKVRSLPSIVRRYPQVALFTGGEMTPDAVCRELTQAGIFSAAITVGENLSYLEERIVTGSLEEIADMSFEGLSVVLVEASLTVPELWPYSTPGVPDDLFVRGKVPMTKEEVRAVTLSKLRLEEDSVVYDIGAGTGSVAVECALAAPLGMVYAIEREPDGIQLIETNVKRFALCNVAVVEGEAPAALGGLEKPDRIFVGGSGGKLSDIIAWTDCLDSFRLVINAVTIESVGEALELLTKKGFSDIDIVSVAIARGNKVGAKHLMQALNPIFIISADKQQEDRP